MPIPKPQEALTVYGLTLMICGALAFQAAGAVRSAASALYVGNGAAVVAFLLAGGVGAVIPKRGEPGFKLSMACVHLALVYPILLAGVLGWRLSKAWNVASKRYIVPYLAVMIAASLLTAACIAAHKPKNDPANATAAAAASPDQEEKEDKKAQ